MLTNKIVREITAVLSVFFAIFLFIALLTFNPSDISALTYNRPVTNSAGPIGAFLSNILCSSFGLSAYLIIAFVGIFCMYLIEKMSKETMIEKMFSCMYLVITFAVLLSLIRTTKLPYYAGGYIGLYISQFLSRIFGNAGAWLITIVLNMAGLLISGIFSAVAVRDIFNGKMKNLTSKKPSSNSHNRETSDIPYNTIGTVKKCTENPLTAKKEKLPWITIKKSTTKKVYKDKKQNINNETFEESLKVLNNNFDRMLNSRKENIDNNKFNVINTVIEKEDSLLFDVYKYDGSVKDLENSFLYTDKPVGSVVVEEALLLKVNPDQKCDQKTLTPFPTPFPGEQSYKMYADAAKNSFQIMDPLPKASSLRNNSISGEKTVNNLQSNTSINDSDTFSSLKSVSIVNDLPENTLSDQIIGTITNYSDTINYSDTLTEPILQEIKTDETPIVKNENITPIVKVIDDTPVVLKIPKIPENDFNIDDDIYCPDKLGNEKKFNSEKLEDKEKNEDDFDDEDDFEEKVITKNTIQMLNMTKEYEIPVGYLYNSDKIDSTEWMEEIKRNSHLLIKTLNDFNIEAKVINVNRGPVITLYELQIAAGTKLTKIVSLSDDIAMALAALRVRIVAPIPGKSAVGIEIPNQLREGVTLGDIINSADYKSCTMTLKVCLGEDILGKPVMLDLKKQPHLLIAGATGAGKSVCVNTIITSLVYNYDPNFVRFIMIDPKMVELQLYNGLPHQLTPVITEPDVAPKALKWAIIEMERRYRLLSELATRDIDRYNQKVLSYGKNTDHEPLPYIVIIIDELADLMMVAPKEVETYITRIAQKARAIGIHVIIATQRPSVDVITGIIKANFPARIAFQVAQKTDSRTIIDQNGAEKLLGKGDMLYQSPTSSFPVRIQGAFISEDEIISIVKHAADYAPPRYIDIEEVIKENELGDADDAGDNDEMFVEAIKIIEETKKASASYLQRRLSIGYNRAARIIEKMEELGYIGPQQGSKPRDVYI